MGLVHSELITVKRLLELIEIHAEIWVLLLSAHPSLIKISKHHEGSSSLYESDILVHRRV